MTTPTPERTPYDGLRVASKEGAPEKGMPNEPAAVRLVPLRALLDALSMWLVVAGGGCGVAAAWLAGGTVPGLATLGGVLAALGLLLTF